MLIMGIRTMRNEIEIIFFREKNNIYEHHALDFDSSGLAVVKNEMFRFYPRHPQGKSILTKNEEQRCPGESKIVTR